MDINKLLELSQLFKLLAASVLRTAVKNMVHLEGDEPDTVGASQLLLSFRSSSSRRAPRSGVDADIGGRCLCLLLQGCLICSLSRALVRPGSSPPVCRKLLDLWHCVELVACTRIPQRGFRWSCADFTNAILELYAKSQVGVAVDSHPRKTLHVSSFASICSVSKVRYGACFSWVALTLLPGMAVIISLNFVYDSVHRFRRHFAVKLRSCRQSLMALISTVSSPQR
eukprot:2802896-Amphidinium_carterae.2